MPPINDEEIGPLERGVESNFNAQTIERKFMLKMLSIKSRSNQHGVVASIPFAVRSLDE